jgi:hypothetical protein
MNRRDRKDVSPKSFVMDIHRQQSELFIGTAGVVMFLPSLDPDDQPGFDGDFFATDTYSPRTTNEVEQVA